MKSELRGLLDNDKGKYKHKRMIIIWTGSLVNWLAHQLDPKHHSLDGKWSYRSHQMGCLLYMHYSHLPINKDLTIHMKGKRLGWHKRCHCSSSIDEFQQIVPFIYSASVKTIAELMQRATVSMATILILTLDRLSLNVLLKLLHSPERG